MKQTLFLILIMLLSWAPVQAQEPEEFNCPALFREVERDMAKANSCWVDADCLAVYFGCPWQRPDCDYAIVSTDDRDAIGQLTAKMAEYELRCIDPDRQYRARCDAQQEDYGRRHCVPPRLKCLNGQCVTQTHVLIQRQWE